MNTTLSMKSISYEDPSEGSAFENVVTLKRIVATSAALLMLALMALGVSTAQASGTWYSTFESARNQSQRDGKPLFVLIARTGCQACTEMEANLSNPTARRALQGAVKVRLESAHNPNMTARYAAGGTPTTLVFAAGNCSQPVYAYTGVMDRGTIIQVGRSISSMN